MKDVCDLCKSVKQDRRTKVGRVARPELWTRWCTELHHPRQPWERTALPTNKSRKSEMEGANKMKALLYELYESIIPYQITKHVGWRAQNH